MSEGLNAAIRRRAQDILHELARDNPQIAAEQRLHRRQLKAWKRSREQLDHQTELLRFEIITALMNPSEPKDEAAEEAATFMLRSAYFMFEQDASPSLILGTLRAAVRLLRRGKA